MDVTAENGNIKEYTINVLRKESVNDDNSLINNYQEYFANLDSDIEDTGSVDQDKLIIDKDGTFE